MAIHSNNLSHLFQLQNTTVLSTKHKHMNQTMREANEIDLHHNNIDRENGLPLNQSQKLPIHSLEACKKPPI